MSRKNSDCNLRIEVGRRIYLQEQDITHARIHTLSILPSLIVFFTFLVRDSHYSAIRYRGLYRAVLSRGQKCTYCLAAVQIQQINGASLALEQLLRLGHDLRDEALEIVLLLEYVPRQVQEYLIAPVLLHGQLEQLCVLYPDAAKGEVSDNRWVGKIRRGIVLINASIARGADYNYVTAIAPSSLVTHDGLVLCNRLNVITLSRPE